MKILSTWTGVVIVLLLAVAMAALAVYQRVEGMKPTGAISAAVLVVVAIILARRIMRRRG